MLRLDPDEKLKLDEQDSVDLNSTLTSTRTVTEIPTKRYADSLFENGKIRWVISTVFNDQDFDFDNDKPTISDSNTVNRNPLLNEEV